MIHSPALLKGLKQDPAESKSSKKQLQPPCKEIHLKVFRSCDGTRQNNSLLLIFLGWVNTYIKYLSSRTQTSLCIRTFTQPLIMQLQCTEEKVIVVLSKIRGKVTKFFQWQQVFFFSCINISTTFLVSILDFRCSLFCFLCRSHLSGLTALGAL